MNPDKVFKITSLFVLIPWVLMILLPTWYYTSLLINSLVIPILLSLVYIFYIVSNFGKAKGDFKSLEGLGRLFKSKGLLLAGWIHYLIFDLFVGAWEWQNSQEIQMPHLLLVPCLIFTLMFGPAGFVLYLGIRMLYLSL